LTLELGANVNGSIVNQGMVQGRGVADGAPDNNTNQAAAVRLYWAQTAGAPTSVFNGNIDNSGTLAAENGAAVLIENQTQLNGDIINSGTIEGGTVGDGQLAIDASKAVGSIRVNNSGTIDGDILLSAGNDLYDGSGGTANGTIFGGDGNDTLIGGEGNEVFGFSSDIYQDGVQDLKTIQGFQAGDSLDFSGYMQAGGSVTFTRTQELQINLGNEDSITLSGDLNAAEQQLSLLT
jgi:hypothetical protein